MKTDLEFITFEVDEFRDLLFFCMLAASTRVRLDYDKTGGEAIQPEEFNKRFNYDIDVILSQKKRRDALE